MPTHTSPQSSGVCFTSWCKHLTRPKTGFRGPGRHPRPSCQATRQPASSESSGNSPKLLDFFLQRPFQVEVDFQLGFLLKKSPRGTAASPTPLPILPCVFCQLTPRANPVQPFLWESNVTESGRRDNDFIPNWIATCIRVARKDTALILPRKERRCFFFPLCSMKPLGISTLYTPQRSP
jgi:hypothetical protein